MVYGLRTARARRAVSLCACGDGLAVGAAAGGTRRGRHGKGIRQRGLAHTSHGLASTSSLAVLLVSSEIERDEQDQVRAENGNA